VPDRVDPAPIGQLHLLERIGQELAFGARFPGPRKLVLVEDAHPHDRGPPRIAHRPTGTRVVSRSAGRDAARRAADANSRPAGTREEPAHGGDLRAILLVPM